MFARSGIFLKENRKLKINGTILMPNEIFSYNKVVGKRTV